jgi:hypothetical protein
MTDALTDAVRRIKKLQQDVERLKSSENEEGQPRLLFSIQEQTTADDAVSVRPPDFENVEAVESADVLNIVDSDINNSETVAADDTQDIRGRQVNSAGRYNRVGYNTASYNDPDSDTRRRRRT